jgi:uncharacterized protein
VQGEHKISRGYLPSATYSSHYVLNPVAAGLIRRSLRRHTIEGEQQIEAMASQVSPFRAESSELQGAIAGIRTNQNAQQAQAE